MLCYIIQLKFKKEIIRIIELENLISLKLIIIKLIYFILYIYNYIRKILLLFIFNI